MNLNGTDSHVTRRDELRREKRERGQVFSLLLPHTAHFYCGSSLSFRIQCKQQLFYQLPPPCLLPYHRTENFVIVQNGTFLGFLNMLVD